MGRPAKCCAQLAQLGPERWVVADLVSTCARARAAQTSAFPARNARRDRACSPAAAVIGLEQSRRRPAEVGPSWRVRSKRAALARFTKSATASGSLRGGLVPAISTPEATSTPIAARRAPPGRRWTGAGRRRGSRAARRATVGAISRSADCPCRRACRREPRRRGSVRNPPPSTFWLPQGGIRSVARHVDLPGSPRDGGQHFVAGKLDDIGIDRGKGAASSAAASAVTSTTSGSAGRATGRSGESGALRWLEGARCSARPGSGRCSRRRHAVSRHDTVLVDDAADLDCRLAVGGRESAGIRPAATKAAVAARRIVRAHQRLTDQCGVEAECPPSNESSTGR